MGETHASPAKYLWIWAWLAGLMLLGVLLSRLPLSREAIVIAVLLLSTIKATLVALYYMHLKFDRLWLSFVAVFPLVLIVLAVGLVYSGQLVKL